MSASDFPCTSYRASSRSLLYRLLAGNAVANDIDAVVALDFVGLDLDRLDVDEAAQRQRQRAALARAAQRLGLFRLQLQGDGLADEGVGAVFFLRRLVDRENPDVGQDDFRTDEIGRLAVGVLFALG